MTISMAHELAELRRWKLDLARRNISRIGKVYRPVLQSRDIDRPILNVYRPVLIKEEDDLQATLERSDLDNDNDDVACTCCKRQDKDATQASNVMFTGRITRSMKDKSTQVSDVTSRMTRSMKHRLAQTMKSG
jgi:hypothetical protein